MSNEAPLLDLQFGVQALRRRVERERTLGGALGVRGEHYPHQVGNVQRVLSGHRIRHLLADEVGMGKTVQAIMIMNALRLQHPELRGLVVVPDQLTNQWRDEQLVRGHLTFPRWMDERGKYREVEQVLEERPVALVWPELMKNHTGESIIDPERFGVLIVDEYHWLTRGLQARVLSEAPRFKHLLLLTATPPVHDPDRLVELLAMLEPERFGAASRDLDPDVEPGDVLARLLEYEAPPTDEAITAILGVGAPSVSEMTPSNLAQALCSLRSVTRARREDYPDLFPRREHVPVLVEPNEAETQRQRLMWRYLSDIEGLPVTLDAEAIAQRVIRGPRTLRERVGWLRRNKCERRGLLSAVAEWLPDNHGDSRFDALVDLVDGIWREEPEARILIAAGDTRTVEELYDKLPAWLDESGPPGAVVSMTAVRLRNLRENPNLAAGAASLTAGEDANQAAVRAFVAGEANVLLSAGEGQVGLNLQVTRHIILYSVPWDPQQVEQWIGRIDRIGNSAVVGGGEELLPVRVYTIAQRGMADEQVVTVLGAAGVLERSVSLQPAAVNAVHEHLTSAALSGSSAAWREVAREAGELSRPAELADVGSRWVSALPWGPDHSNRTFKYLDEAAPEPAAMAPAEFRSGLWAQERALNGWLHALGKAREYDIRKAGREIRTIGYVDSMLPKNLGFKTSNFFGASDRSSSSARVQLGADLIPRANQPAHFISERRFLRQPPRGEVETARGHRPLYFLDHGSPVHERLVDGWLGQGRTTPSELFVRLPDSHPAGELRGETVRVVVRWADPASLLPPATEPDDVDYAADMRFLRWALPPLLLLGGARHSEGRAALVLEPLLESLLSPSLERDRTKRPRAIVSETAPDARQALTEHGPQIDRALLDRVARRWSPRLERVRDAVDGRVFCIGADGTFEVRNLDADIAVLTQDLSDLELLDEAAFTSAVKARRTRLSRRRAGLEEARAARVGKLRERAGRLQQALKTPLDACIIPYLDVMVRIG